MHTRTITLTVDETDYAAIQEAIARRQAWRVMPDAEGDIAGRVLAEICRGWMEPPGDSEEDEWKKL